MSERPTTQTNEKKEPTGLDLQGSIEHFNLPDILQFIGQIRKSGVLAIQREEELALIYFQEGRVSYAYAPRKTHHIGQLLRERGKINASQLSQAVATQANDSSGSPPRLGQILMDMGAVDRADIIETVTAQVEELLYSLLSWKTGSFKFYENQFPTEEEITVNISTENIILEGLRRLDEMNHLRDTLPSMNSRLLIAQSVGDGINISLKPEEWNLLALIDGRRTIQDIVEISNLSEIETLKKIAALKLAGLITVLGEDEIEETDGANKTTGAGTDHLEAMMTRLAGLLEEFLQGSASPAPSFSGRSAGRNPRMVGAKPLTEIIAESAPQGGSDSDKEDKLWNDLTS